MKEPNSDATFRPTTGALSAVVMEAVPIACALASLGSFAALGDAPLTASRAFVSLLVFNQLRMPLMILPMTIVFVIGGAAAVSVRGGSTRAPPRR